MWGRSGFTYLTMFQIKLCDPDSWKRILRAWFDSLLLNDYINVYPRNGHVIPPPFLTPRIPPFVYTAALIGELLWSFCVWTLGKFSFHALVHPHKTRLRWSDVMAEQERAVLRRTCPLWLNMERGCEWDDITMTCDPCLSSSTHLKSRASDISKFILCQQWSDGINVIVWQLTTFLHMRLMESKRKFKSIFKGVGWGAAINITLTQNAVVLLLGYYRLKNPLKFEGEN